MLTLPMPLHQQAKLTFTTGLALVKKDKGTTYLQIYQRITLENV